MCKGQYAGGLPSSRRTLKHSNTSIENVIIIIMMIKGKGREERREREREE